MDPHVLPVVYSMLMSAVETIDEDDAKAVSLIREAKRLIEQRLQEQLQPSAANGPAGLTRWQMKRVEQYIERYLAQSILVADLAAEIGLCVSHFTRLFRVSYGASPYHHVLRRRVESAKRMLQASNAPLSEVALDCGLSDQSHLTRIFRRFTGITPSAWRRLSRSN